MEKNIEYIGKTFNYLTILDNTEVYLKYGNRVAVLCQCVCGKTLTPLLYCVINGITKSCGCKRKTPKKHGMSRSKEYDIWIKMKARCHDPKDKRFKWYGIRGITVCNRWLNSFENFISDMGLRPSKELSLERIDNNKGYYPENCIWATKKQQSRNTRQNVWVVYEGKNQLLIELCDRFGIKSELVNSRLWYGWDLHKALTMPKHTTLGRKAGSKNKKSYSN